VNKLAQSLMAKYGPKVHREGSRGGHVIGHEKDGDPIYASSKKATAPRPHPPEKPKAPPEAAPLPVTGHAPRDTTQFGAHMAQWFDMNDPDKVYGSNKNEALETIRKLHGKK